MTIEFAPLQGYTDHIYRNLHASHYGGADAYYTPFIRVEKGEPRRQDLAHLTTLASEVPQVIFKSAEEFSILLNALKERGRKRIDLNLGCPYPMQTRKGRGAAMIANTEEMGKIADMMRMEPEIAFSVKMRLGLEQPDEWLLLMPVLNSLPLSHIALHPRTSGQMYGGEMHEDQVDSFVDMSTNPVLWNADIARPGDIDDVMARHKGLAGVMIGRGMLARPSLAAEWREGREWDVEERLTRLQDFHDLLLEKYEECLCGQTQVLMKIKAFWDYADPAFTRQQLKRIHKAGTTDRYRQAVDAAFQEAMP